MKLEDYLCMLGEHGYTSELTQEIKNEVERKTEAYEGANEYAREMEESGMGYDYYEPTDEEEHSG